MKISKGELKQVVKNILNEELGAMPLGSTGFGQPQAQQQTQTGQQKDQPIETAMLSALQKDTALMTKLKGITNFNQIDSLIKSIISLTSIQDTQIKTGLNSLSKTNIQTQAKV
jgi:hypothetical protein